MGRYIGSSCRLCRSEGIKLFLKGTRCNTEKCAMTRRAYSPGQHGKTKRKLSNYGLQLREKQKVKRMYGVLEKQFRRYFHNASKIKGVTGEILLQQLERRLDNVILRSGFAVSLTQARQIVRHGMIYVNDKRVNIPSYPVDKEDTILVKNKEKIQKYIKNNAEVCKDREVPGWIAVDKDKLTTKIQRLPSRSDITLPIKEQLIVELYSK
ncbi:MAG: 30S ribosomal protein S4 [Candidatus Omnitrophica bacterium]|nr:30S ribosomal protein S4 [Candidatus Omnitrophota bacterium]